MVLGFGSAVTVVDVDFPRRRAERPRPKLPGRWAILTCATSASLLITALAVQSGLALSGLSTTRRQSPALS